MEKKQLNNELKNKIKNKEILTYIERKRMEKL